MSSASRSARSSRIGKREAFLGCLAINLPVISFSGSPASPSSPLPAPLPFLPLLPLPRPGSKYSRAGWGSRSRTQRGHVHPHMLGRTLRGTWEGAGRGRGGAGARPSAHARWPPRPLPRPPPPPRAGPRAPAVGGLLCGGWPGAGRPGRGRGGQAGIGRALPTAAPHPAPRRLAGRP